MKDNCTKPNCDCVAKAEEKAGGPVKSYPCLADNSDLAKALISDNTFIEKFLKGEWVNAQQEKQQATEDRPDIEVGTHIKLYGKETTVKGFYYSYNEGLGKYETIILTEGRGDPLERSMDVIEILSEPEAHEAQQPPTDAVAFYEWITESGLYHRGGRWFKEDNKGNIIEEADSIVDLYKLFNPSGASPQPSPTNIEAIKAAIEKIIEDGYDKNTRATGGGYEADTTHCHGLVEYVTPLLINLLPSAGMLEAVYEGAAQWEERCRSAEDALKALVNLKDWKERSGKDSAYLAQKPLAWAAGRNHLATYYDEYEKQKLQTPAPPAAGPITEKLVKALEQVMALVKGELDSKFNGCAITDCKAALETYYKAGEQSDIAQSVIKQDERYFGDRPARKEENPLFVPTPTGPVWVKATTEMPVAKKEREKISVKYKGSPDVLIFLEGKWHWWDDLHDKRNNGVEKCYAVNLDSWAGIEWLKESPHQVFTWEQAEAIFKAGEVKGLDDYYTYGNSVKPNFQEYMNTNYPPIKK